MGTEVEDWNKFFNKYFGRTSGYKLDNLVVGLTPVDGRDRGLQIQTELEVADLTQNIDKDLEYLIIDDDINDITPYHKAENIIKVDPTKGLDNNTLDKIFKKFLK